MVRIAASALTPASISARSLSGARRQNHSFRRGPTNPTESRQTHRLGLYVPSPVELARCFAPTLDPQTTAELQCATSWWAQARMLLSKSQRKNHCPVRPMIRTSRIQRWHDSVATIQILNCCVQRVALPECVAVSRFMVIVRPNREALVVDLSSGCLRASGKMHRDRREARADVRALAVRELCTIRTVRIAVWWVQRVSSLGKSRTGQDEGDGE